MKTDELDTAKITFYFVSLFSLSLFFHFQTIVFCYICCAQNVIFYWTCLTSQSEDLLPFSAYFYLKTIQVNTMLFSKTLNQT